MDFKNEAQEKRAILEDSLVDLVYKHFGNFVLHGGTAIWRCYGGNRFSRDLDFYANMTKNSESSLQKRMHRLLTDSGYPVVEEGYNNKSLTLHITLRGYGTTGKLDITFGRRRGEAVEYKRVDGAKRVVYSLSAEELLNEKSLTYLDKFKNGAAEIQDLYDMLVLKDRVPKPSSKTLHSISVLLAEIGESPPENEKELTNLLLSGVGMPFRNIMESLEGWLHEHTQ